MKVSLSKEENDNASCTCDVIISLKLKRYGGLICQICEGKVEPEIPKPVPVIIDKAKGRRTYFVTNSLDVIAGQYEEIPQLDQEEFVSVSIHKKPRTKVEKALGYFAYISKEEGQGGVVVEHVKCQKIGYRFAPFKHSDTFIRRATLEYLQSIYDMFDLIMDDPNITTFIFEFLNISTILPMLKPRGKKKKRRRKKRKQSVLVEIKNEKNLPKPQVKKKKEKKKEELA